jgi:hypothetical protein
LFNEEKLQGSSSFQELSPTDLPLDQIDLATDFAIRVDQ